MKNKFLETPFHVSQNRYMSHSGPPAGGDTFGGSREFEISSFSPGSPTKLEMK